MIVVLAITGARDAARAGVDAVAGQSLAAIVERRGRRPAVTEAALRTHASKLAELEALGLTILPVRFGTVLPDEGALRELLGPREKSLKRVLAFIKGKRQMTVRVRGERRTTPRSSGRAYLAARAKAARVADADPVRRAVSGMIVAEETGPARGPFSGAVYHLIKDADVDDYVEAIASLQRKRPGRFVLSGPMPAFAFMPVADLGGDL